MDPDGAIPPVGAAWAVVIRSFAFLRKEVVEILRQPKLVALLVVGPFALLILFGLGYSETSIVKRAVFVGSEGSVYEEVLQTYEEDLADFIDSRGLVTSEAEGRALLAAEEIDVVVVFPDDAVERITAGERAVIRVIHDEVDPIQQGTVEVAARLAIQEVNATVLATIAGEAEEAVPDSANLAERLAVLADSLADDPTGTREALGTELGDAELALEGSATVLDRLRVDQESRDSLESARTDLLEVNRELEAVSDSPTDAELQSLAESVRSLSASIDEAVVLDPNVLVRPFRSETDDLLPGQINPTEYFTPSSLVLLLQHLALTFAALSLVRDRRTGLFELMRVGPLSSVEIIIGKIFAYLLVGVAVGAVLIAASVTLLSVPLEGSVGWLALVVLGVLLASLSLGMVLAIGARTESQAVQYAMLALLGGLFFSGFILPIDGLSPVVRIVSWLLPVTYGVDAFQDIMLRGIAPDTEMMIGLLILVGGYGLIAVLGLKNQLRAGGTT
ncbi:MAG: ABC transporter permease [Ilumatobacter sp.]|nr:ABC transporter permease [Ilumatobacter sp.]